MAHLYAKYGESLYAIAFKLTGSPDDAEDVVQEIFSRLPFALRTFDGRGSFDSWLRRIATTTALIELRRQSRYVSLTTLGDSPALGSAPADSVEQIALEEAIDNLPETMRIVLMLHEIDGLTHEEIGIRLGIKWVTSGQRLHRARMALRSALERPSCQPADAFD